MNNRVEKIYPVESEKFIMVKMELKDCKPYDPPNHFGMSAIRLHGKEESGAEFFWMGMSHFLPGGGASYDASPAQKIYFVLEGEITVYTESMEKIVLNKWDSICIAANEGRSLVNESNRPTTMLVTINYLNA